MNEHERIRRILASYAEASRDEQAAASAHLASCAACAEQAAAYAEVDVVLQAEAGPALPARLARPFAALLREHDADRSRRAGPVWGRAFAPAAIVLVLLAALSVFVWSVNTARTPVTSTPTLTTTLTPTSIAARETGPAVLTALRAANLRPRLATEVAPTPAPAPEPVAGNGAVLFAAPVAHATIAH